MQQKSNSIPVNSIANTFGTEIFVGRMTSKNFHSYEHFEEFENIKQSHRDEYHLFFLQEKGTTTIEIDFHKHTLKPSSVIFIHQNQVHRTLSFKNAVVSIWAISNENLNSEYLDFLEDITPAKPLSLKAEVCSIISEAVSLSIKIFERKNDKLYHANALLSVMMFQIGARGNVGATKLDIVSDITSITEHYLDIVNSYISKSGHQGAILGNAHVIAYNLNQQYLAGTVIEKEACKSIDARFQSKEVGILTKMKQSTNKKQAARGPSIANVPKECRDWYLVEHFSDGSSDWYYMYTVCSSNADGGGSGSGYGGGGGGGGGGTGGATYFYESPAEPVDLQEAINCFNGIPSTADTRYKVTIHTHLANPNLPTQVYNFSDGDPGHAYITLEKTSGSTSHSLTFGFYPSTDTWITGTKNAVGSAVGEEVPATRRSHASYTVTVDERTFRNVCNTSACKGASQYDLNNYNCIDCAIDVFNAAFPSTKPFSVADKPDWFYYSCRFIWKIEPNKQCGSFWSINESNECPS